MFPLETAVASVWLGEPLASLPNGLRLGADLFTNFVAPGASALITFVITSVLTVKTVSSEHWRINSFIRTWSVGSNHSHHCVCCSVTVVTLTVSVLHAQAPSLSTAGELRSQPVVKVRFWIWRDSCTWVGFPPTAPTSSCPPNSGQRCSITATWAASVTFSLTVEAKTSVRLPRHKMAPASNPHATSSRESSARATPARTEGSAKKAGIDSSVTAPGLDTGHARVREVTASPFHC